MFRLTIAMTAMLAASLALRPATVTAEEPLGKRESASRINAANELLRNEQITAAIDAYSEIEASDSHRDSLNYNLAVAHYLNGDLDSAATLFEQSAASVDTRFAAGSRYNLGNCLYSAALPLVEQDPDAAVEKLRSAIDQYRGSLRLNPNHSDARANIELAAELIKQIEQQQQEQQQEQEQQQQQQDQQQQDQQQQDQQQSSQDQQSSRDDSQQNNEQQQNEQQPSDPQQDQSQDSAQQSADDPSSDQAEQNQQADDQPTDDQQGGDQQQSNQQDSQDSDSDSNQQSESNNDQDANDDPTAGQWDNRRSNPNQPQSPDAQAPGAPDEGEQGEQEDDTDPQEVPAGELTATNDSDADDGQAAFPAGESGKEQLMTRQEALKLLQSVRDRDMLRRLRQQQIERARRVPVERDW